MKLKLITIFSFLTLFAFGQNPEKKTLGHEELVSWNRIRNTQISQDGSWVTYRLQPEEGNATLKIYDAKRQKEFTFERGTDAKISFDNEYVFFKIKVDEDTLGAMQRRKVKKDDLSKDTLGIYNLKTGELEKIANVKSFKRPEKWSGWLAYHKEIEKPKKDTTSTKMDESETVKPDSLQKKKPKVKKETKKSGTKLVLRNLKTGKEEILPFVKNYLLSEEGSRIMARSTGSGKDSVFLAGVYVYETKTGILKNLMEKEGEFKNLAFDKTGQQVAFNLNLDTTEMQISPVGLAYWKSGMETAEIIADTAATFLPDGWRVSENGKPSFSENGEKLFFGIAPVPILRDTNILDDEVVNVEVWSYQDGMLHTQQNYKLKEEKKRTYEAVYHVSDKKIVQLGDKTKEEVRKGDEGNARYALAFDEKPYLLEAGWEGVWRKDLYLIDTETGEEKTVAKAIAGRTRFSPKAEFIYWYNNLDSAWFAYEIDTEKVRQITSNQSVRFYDEINDRPMHPWSYNISGWTKDDNYILINDRYDIWKIDPRGNEAPVNLTNGRSQKLVYRYARLDKEERNIDMEQPLLLHVFDENTKGGGYVSLNKGNLKTLLFDGNFRFQRRPYKAQNADRIVFTKQNFQTFPDLRITDTKFFNPKQISSANPQQNDYSWGTIELYQWTDLNGNQLTGQLVKPENFDPNKKYPMLVNFYEKSSDRLHSHRTPLPGRSTINYPFYASKGYVIFNPDVPYRIGYPGESALNAVVSGVTSLIDKGFVDREKIGVQGHSWGGYQVAYLINHTDIFACAESGAPVVNMFSAYGGIRWGSGLSRMFQYEHTQSRIGGTIWDYPLRYIENSPIFDLDKCNTPVLILHNDKDGAVPWYQGIEYFVGLRRLGKPAWMLNYNDEPHWPVKLPNRKDFNIRMQQYFDYYLLDAPMPRWMKRGVPAMEKGILQGLELETRE